MVKEQRRCRIGKISSRRNHIRPHTALKIASDIIKDLENGKTRLAHMGPISQALRRPIRVYVKSLAYHHFGSQPKKSPINVVYHRYQPEDFVGYWINVANPVELTKNSVNTEFSPKMYSNDVLYSIAVAAGKDPEALRKQTVRIMRKNINNLANGVNSLLTSIKSPVRKKQNISSKYSGKSVTDARKLLDRSQNGQCHPDGNSGHPRGHASHPGCTDPQGSVENYSRSGWKTAFLSRSEQDLVAHLALKTQNAKRMMTRLNEGSTKEAGDIMTNDLDWDRLPLAQQWQNGKPLGQPEHYARVCMVLKHFLNKQNDPNADPFVLTFYPVLRRG